jgi:hypothetical protein
MIPLIIAVVVAILIASSFKSTWKKEEEFFARVRENPRLLIRPVVVTITLIALWIMFGKR